MITPQGNHQRFSVMLPVLAAVLFCAAEQPTVKVAPMDSVGPRPMEQQTQSSLVRDYLQAWQSMGSAFGQNRADLLDGVLRWNGQRSAIENDSRTAGTWNTGRISRPVA